MLPGYHDVLPILMMIGQGILPLPSSELERTARIWFAGRVDDFQQSLPSYSWRLVPCNVAMSHSHQGELVSLGKRAGHNKSQFDFQVDSVTS